MSLLAGALLSGVLGVGKAVLGGIQSARGNKEMKNLLANRPQYSIPEAYMKSLGIYQNMAAGEMPGMDKYQQMYGEATARAMSGAERGAISSNVYQGAVENAQDKELQALQQLALMGTQYKTQAMQNLAGAQTQMGQLQDQAWNYNTAMPYDIKLNMANEKRQAGAQNLWGGLNDAASTAMNYVGTKYYADVMKGMYPNQGSSNQTFNPNQQFSKPLTPALGTTGSLWNNIPPINYPK